MTHLAACIDELQLDLLQSLPLGVNEQRLKVKSRPHIEDLLAFSRMVIQIGSDIFDGNLTISELYECKYILLKFFLFWLNFPEGNA